MNNLCECGCGLPTSIAEYTNPKRSDIKGQPRRFRRGHYQRVYVSPNLGRKERDMAERFWEKVDKSGECWLWTSTCYPNGRGQFKVHGKTLKAYRVAYELAYGPIPEGLMVCHKCDNPTCVRPEHLFLGTCGDNLRDASAKGRTASGDRNGQIKHPESRLRGENHPWRLHPELLDKRRGELGPNAKLTEEQVLDIRRRYTDGESQKALAVKYGVRPGCIWAIVTGKTWTHLELVPRA